MPRDDPVWAILGRLRHLPVIARDAVACLCILGVFAASAALPALEVPLALVVLVPTLLLVALAFGRTSAFLAALLTAALARFGPLRLDEGSGTLVNLLILVALFGAAIGVSALLEALRRRRADAERAHALMDAAVRSATARAEEARRNLDEAEARLAVARRQARDAVKPAAPPGDPIDAAMRSEGGI